MERAPEPPRREPPAEASAEPPTESPDRDEGPAAADLATIGLAAFFLSLIAIVGALLILPAIL